MQNYAVLAILRLPRLSNIIIHLKSLHWLSVKVRNTNEIACLCHHCHSSTAPSYVVDKQQKKPSHTRNNHSSSYTMPLLNISAHSRITLNDRSFSFASSLVFSFFFSKNFISAVCMSYRINSIHTCGIQGINFTVKQLRRIYKKLK